MVFTVSQIVCGPKVLKKWYGCQIPDISTFVDAFSEFASGNIDKGLPLDPEFNTVCTKISVSRNSSDTGVEVQPHLAISDVTNALGIFIQFYVRSHEDSKPQNLLGSTSKDQTNAFSVLMNATKMVDHLPPAFTGTTNKIKMKNDILDMLKRNNVGWTALNAPSLGIQFVNTVTECLWLLDGNQHTLESRGCTVPKLFQSFVNYNKPETHKHKRKHIENLSSSLLIEQSVSILNLTEMSFMRSKAWVHIRESLLQLAMNLRKYVTYLEHQKDKSSERHAKKSFEELFSNQSPFQIFNPTISTIPSSIANYKSLSNALTAVEEYKPIFLNNFAPAEPWRKFKYIKELTLPVCVVKFTYTSAQLNMVFIWKVPVSATSEDIINKSTSIRDELQKDIPKYHTRAMRSEFTQSFGRVTGIKCGVLREAYKRLTGDNSASTNQTTLKIDERISEMLDMQDPDLIWDLRKNNVREQSYQIFLEECQRYIDGVVETSVDDRRHDPTVSDGNGNHQVITHLAVAMSVRDLLEQVSKRLPEGTPIPSKHWLRLQFWPRKISTATSRCFTGKLNLKFMVQARQFRKSHEDCHYASALFRYEKSFAVKYRENVDFICMDDKHTCKVGEPGYPVAAVERGRQVIVAKDKIMAVGDHDFTRISLTPSVTFSVDVPEDTEGSFYRGKVFVGLKGNCFEASSPLRHITELNKILEREGRNKEILCVYTDGGPDHRCTYYSVKLALICLFLKGDKDMVVAVRTPPYNSWKDPAERIMSLLNIGLQSVGLVRNALEDQDLEKKLAMCSNMSEIRHLAEKEPSIKDALKKSLQPVKDLIEGVFSRLSLKDEPFQIFQAASDEEIDSIWEELRVIDATITRDDTTQIKLKNKSALMNFMKTHCLERHYMFSVKKCGLEDCHVCSSPRLTPEIFQTLNHLPDPVPRGDHYEAFETLYGTETEEIHRPSFNPQKVKGHNVPFSPSIHRAKMANIVIQCEECCKWRVLHAEKKLRPDQRNEVLGELDNLSYTCGSIFQDIEGYEESFLKKNEVYVRKNISCSDKISIHYYGAGHEIVCIHCGTLNNIEERNSQSVYPMCHTCITDKKDWVTRNVRVFKP